jgi:futalosine hydrolase
MNILLVAATAKEIEPFFEYYRNTKRPQNIDILITGIGLTSATYHLLKQIQLKKPRLIIQAGVAGCFDKKIPLGKVVAVKKETIADQGVIEFKKLKTIFDLELMPHDQFPYIKGWLVNKSKILNELAIEKVNAISVNEITTSAEKIKLYKKRFNPAIESMEGSALHYVCLMEKVPFIQIRGISNYIAERNKEKWKMKKAIKNLNKELIRLVELIGEYQVEETKPVTRNQKPES